MELDVTDKYIEQERQNEIEKVKAYKITKSNDFIRNARSDLSALQSKIVAFIISRIEPEDIDFKTIEFSISEFCDVCGMQPTGMYSYLKENLKKLRDRSIWVTREDEDGNIVEETFSWLSKVGMGKSKGTITLYISDDLKPYLLELKENFTTYSLNEVLNFRCSYSAWFYDNIASMAKLTSWTVSVDEIRKQNFVEYEYKHLRARVIDPAITEINEYTSYNVQYVTLKKGKKIERIKFLISIKTLAERVALSEKLSSDKKN